MEKRLTITVNGKKETITTDSNRSLLDVLREGLNLTGTKYSCGEGKCKNCTVLMNGKAVLACITPMSKADGKEIITIEGLVSGDSLHPVQKAFLDEEAFPCGYCTSGMIMTTVDLLEKKLTPTDDEILEHMDGHLCRCGVYAKILKAVRRAADNAAEVKVK